MNLLLLVLLLSVIATSTSSPAEDVNTKPASEASPATPQPETKSVLGWVGNKSRFKGKIPRLPRGLPKAMSVIPNKEHLDGYWGVISEAIDLIPDGSNKTSQKTLVEVSPSFHPLKTLLPGHNEGKVEPPKPVNKKLSQSAKKRKFTSSVFKPWPGLMNGRWKRRMSTDHDEPSSHRRKSSDEPHSSLFRRERSRLKPSFAIFSHKTTTTPKPNFSPFRRNKEPSKHKQSNPKKNFIPLRHNRGSTSQPNFKPIGFEELNSPSDFGYSSHDEFASQSNSGSPGHEEYTSQSDFDHEDSQTEHEEYLPQSNFDSGHEKPPSESDLASHEEKEYESQSDFDSLGNKDSASHFSSTGMDQSRPQSNLDSPSDHDKQHSSFSPFRHQELPSHSYFQSVPPDESKRHFRFNAVRDQKADSHFRQPEPQTQSYFASSKPRESIFQKNFESSQHPESNPGLNFKSMQHPESNPRPKYKSTRHPESNPRPNFKSTQHPESNPRPKYKSTRHPESNPRPNFKSTRHPESNPRPKFKSARHPESNQLNFKSTQNPESNPRPNFKSSRHPESNHRPEPLRKEKTPSHSSFSLAEEEPSSPSTSESTRPSAPLPHSSHWPSPRPDKRPPPSSFFTRPNDSALPPQEHLRQLLARPKENDTHENFVYYSTNPDPTNQGAEHHLAIVEVPKGARGRIPLNNVHVIAPQSSRGNMPKGEFSSEKGSPWTKPYMVKQGDGEGDSAPYLVIPFSERDTRKHGIDNVALPLQKAPPEIDQLKNSFNQLRSSSKAESSSLYGSASVGFGPPKNEDLVQKGIRQYSSQRESPEDYPYNTGHPQIQSISPSQPGSFKYGPPKTRSIIRPQDPMSPAKHYEPSPPSSQAYSTPPENQNYQSEPESPPTQYSPQSTYFPPSPMPAPPSTKNSPKRWPDVITTPKPAAPASTSPAETPPQIYRTHPAETPPQIYRTPPAETPPQIYRTPNLRLPYVRHTRKTSGAPPERRFPFNLLERSRKTFTKSIRDFPKWLDGVVFGDESRNTNVIRRPQPSFRFPNYSTREKVRGINYPNIEPATVQEQASNPAPTQNTAQFFSPPKVQTTGLPIRTRNPAFFSQPPLGKEQTNNLISESIRNTNAAFHTKPTSVEVKVKKPSLPGNFAFNTKQVKKTPLPGNFAFNTKSPVTEGQTNNLIYKIPAENLAFFSKLPKHSLSILRDINKSNPGKSLAIYSKVRKPSSPQEQIPNPTSPNEISAFHPTPNADLIEEQQRNSIESEEGAFPPRPQALVAQQSSSDYDLSTALQSETQIHRLNPVSLMSKVQMPFGQSANTLVREDAQAPVEENHWSATLPFFKQDKFVPLHRGGSGVQGLDPIVNVADPFLSDTEKDVDIIPPQSNPGRAKQNVDFKKYKGPKMIMFTLEDAIPLLRHGSERNVFIAPSLGHGDVEQEDFMHSSATGSSFSTVVMPPRHLLRRNPNQYYVPRGRPEAQMLRSIFPSSITSNATDLSEDEEEESEGEDAETSESDAIPEEIKDNLPFYDLLSLGAKLKSPVVAQSKKVQQNPLKSAKKSFFQRQKTLSQESQASESKQQSQSQDTTYRPFFFSQSQSKKEKNPSERVSNFQRQKQTNQPRNRTPRPRFNKYPNFTESKQRQTDQSRGTKKHRNMEPVGKSKFRSSFDEIKSLVSDNNHNNSTLDKTENEEESQPETTPIPLQKPTLQPIYIAATKQSNRQVRPSKPIPRRENFFSRLFSQVATGTGTGTNPKETTTAPKWGSSFNRQSKQRNETRHETKGAERNPFGFKFLKSSSGPPQSRAAPKDSKTSSFGSMFASATSREGASKRAKSIEEAVSLDDLMGAYAENMDEILGSHSEPESLVLKWPKYKRPAFKTDAESGEESMKTSATNESLGKGSLESTAPEAIASESDQVEEEHVPLSKEEQLLSERQKKLENASPFQKFKKLLRKKEVKILKAERAQRDEASESQIATVTEISVTPDPSTDSTTTTATPPSTTPLPQTPTTFKLSRKDAHTIKPTNFLSMLRKRQKQWRSNKQSTPSQTAPPLPKPTPTARAFHVQRPKSKPFSSRRQTTTVPSATNAHTGRKRPAQEEEPQASESKVSERRKKRPVLQQTFHHYLDWEPSKFRPTITSFHREDASNVTPPPTPKATELSPERKQRRKLRRKSYEPKFSFGRNKDSETESNWSPVDKSDFHESLSLPLEGLLQEEEKPLPSAREDNSKGVIYQSNSYTNVNVESSARKHPS